MLSGVFGLVYFIVVVFFMCACLVDIVTVGMGRLL